MIRTRRDTRELHGFWEEAARTLPKGRLKRFGLFLLLAGLLIHRSTIGIVRIQGGSDMASGTVKWFNGQKGYGFIQPDTGGKDVFVHISAVDKAGLSGLPEGAKITYDVVPNKGKESAENLKVT
jgi:CspA family cold shock protein